MVNSVSSYSNNLEETTETSEIFNIRTMKIKKSLTVIKSNEIKISCKSKHVAMFEKQLN